MTILHILYHYPEKCEVLEASIFLLVTIFSVDSSQKFYMYSIIQSLIIE